MVNLNKLKVISLIGIFLAFSVVALGAWTRLVDAGLGCPDWPGCYGFVWMPTTEAEIIQAKALYPETELEVEKAQQQVADAINNIEAGILFWDKNDQLVLTNSYMENLFGEKIEKLRLNVWKEL